MSFNDSRVTRAISLLLTEEPRLVDEACELMEALCDELPAPTVRPVMPTGLSIGGFPIVLYGGREYLAVDDSVLVLPGGGDRMMRRHKGRHRTAEGRPSVDAIRHRLWAEGMRQWTELFKRTWNSRIEVSLSLEGDR
ncbi:hypothetical protein SEA_TAPIOCA_45 [Mycobacterium phage Tapioca]|uniref:Uncharacterized protein n=9 Tax=Charlievirus TaxID=1623280 RepID=A0A142K7W3_9CAUD|nr:hypothetical protein AVV74_gp43 [Mycobacterium phage Carcharodon]YP_009616896.1 hypothetical protein FDI84_gp43 [Mycobacterium phage Pipsqueaks]YP_010052179.1 hypothetical protein KD932_gp42 [Mycobacterium phage Fulbright]YP_010052318.1 hypothetical protein KD934_gp45 [Mycobacterium phage Tapioca]AMS01989.1 hypothetical protein SEA_XERXES_43 [Mycobacterium phage Xerxes]AWY04125.1 hypothetical protein SILVAFIGHTER_44 [Mycobacterium phage Silvafighter]AXQ52613.1 hypothetical protein SEA_GEX_